MSGCRAPIVALLGFPFADRLRSRWLARWAPAATLSRTLLPCLPDRLDVPSPRCTVVLRGSLRGRQRRRRRKHHRPTVRSPSGRWLPRRTTPRPCNATSVLRWPEQGMPPRIRASNRPVDPGRRLQVSPRPTHQAPSVSAFDRRSNGTVGHGWVGGQWNACEKLTLLGRRSSTCTLSGYFTAPDYSSAVAMQHCARRNTAKVVIVA